MFNDYFTTEEIQSLRQSPCELLFQDKEVFEFLRNYWKYNFRNIGFENLAETIFGYIAQNPAEQVGKLAENINVIINSDRDFKRHARRSRRFGSKMDFSFSLFKQLSPRSFDSIVDFGCGKMAFLRKLAKENHSIQTLIGFDPASNPGEAIFDPRVRFYTSYEDLALVSDIECVYSSFVFHHLTSEEIQSALTLIHKILKKNGVFILVEESFSEQSDIIDSDLLGSTGFILNEGLTGQFLQLNSKQKFLALYCNDVLINTKNILYMPWTFEYKTIESWKKTVEQHGFDIEKSSFIAIPETGRLKQGITGVLKFIKR